VGPTNEQIQAAQGTRNSEKAPWETYSEEMDVKMSEQLAAAVEEYAQNYHDSTSNQNKEELARWQEQNYDAMGEYRWCSPEEYADVEARIGRIMHSSELINRLRKIGVKCWYRQHPQEDKITLLVQKGDGLLPPEVGCWVKSGYMPEYTVMGFDEHGVPLAEKYRGWRTCLLQLILKCVITEQAAHKEFGPAERRCAERYNSILHGIRNTVIE
jgi:hypothetical protein